MTAPHLQYGAESEELVENLLRRNGWEIRDRNFRCKGGELDIVAARGDVLALVEVKSRLEVSADHFQPDVTIDPKKIRKLVIAARTWLAMHDGELDGLFPRFDVITVIGRGPFAKIEHLEDAFEAPGG